LAIAWHPLTLESQSSALKTRIFASLVSKEKTGNCNLKLFSRADDVTWITPWRQTAPQNVRSPKCPIFENQTRRLCIFRVRL